MARPLRIEYPGALYHITSRGNAGQNIFLNSEDGNAFLDILGNVCIRHKWNCYAYCLMSNHYHLLLETAESNLSKGMRQLNGVYTQYHNRKHNRSGHIFQGRFKSVIVDKDKYFLDIIRHILSNPVRTNSVKESRQWKWSSYRYVVQDREIPKWMSIKDILEKFSDDEEEAVDKFKKFMIEIPEKEESIWNDLKKQIYLGDSEFINRIQNLINRSNDLSEIPKTQRNPTVKSINEYLKISKNKRNKAMSLAFLSGGYTLKEIAEHFSIHYSTVSRAIKKFES